MAKLVTNQQSLTTGVQFPQGRYSRTVSIEMVVPAVVGGEVFNFTPPLGSNLWLHSVDFYAFGVDAGLGLGGFIGITKGSTIPKTVFEVLVLWEQIVQYNGLKPYIYWWGIEKGHLHWDMNKLYTGDSVRFGCAITTFFSTHQWYAHVNFHFSEG
jgi:hypothetical protein